MHTHICSYKKNYMSYYSHNFYQAGMDASQMHFGDVSCSVSETSQRGLRRLLGDVSEISQVFSEMSLSYI